MEIENNKSGGYIENGFIVLHVKKYSHSDENDKSVYKPYRFAINPDSIICVEENSDIDSEIYFKTKQNQTVMESYDEVMSLLKQFKSAKNTKTQPLYD